MAAEEKETLLGQDEFRNFRKLGLVYAALSGLIGLMGLAYFCTVVALAGTDTDATNMTLVVLSTLSICVSLAGTAVVALKFRSTNTRLKCITAVFVGQTVLNMLLALLVIAIGSASIPIAIETTAHTAVVVVPVLYLLCGVLTFAAGVFSLYAVFFRFPRTPKKKAQHRLFTVSKTHRLKPSKDIGGDERDSFEEALEVEALDTGSPSQAFGRHREKESSKIGSDTSGGDGEAKERHGGRGKLPDGKKVDLQKRPRGPEAASSSRDSENAAASIAAPARSRTAASAGRVAGDVDERLLIAVDALPRPAKRTNAGSASGGSGGGGGGGSGGGGGNGGSDNSRKDGNTGRDSNDRGEEGKLEQQESQPAPPPPPPPPPKRSPSATSDESSSQRKQSGESVGVELLLSPSPQPGTSSAGGEDH